jgi:hypothetical protein
MLQERAAARGVALPRQVAPEPKELGQVLTDLHEKPGRLRDILGPGGAQPQQQAQGSNPITNLLTSPQAKAVLRGHHGHGRQARHAGFVWNGVAHA